jgi:D-alanyl-D-alanine carboxypeptidase
MHSTRRSILPVLILLLAAASASAAAALPGDDQALASKIDQILSPTFKAGEPGAALLIQKDGRTLIRKGYGMADLELGIPIDPDMSFRLGSVTKQFTAVALLMLEEQGKLSV